MWIPQEISLKHNEGATEEDTYDSLPDDEHELNVVLNLPTLFQAEESTCKSHILPKVQLALQSSSQELHMTASNTFKIILEKKLIHPSTFTQTFLQSILASLDARDAAVSNAWLETLLDVIGLLPVDNIKSDIFPLAVQKAQLNESADNRIVSCKLLGRIAQRLDQSAVKKDVLSLLLSLCQDNKAVVRASAAAQLCHVARALGVEDVKPQVLPSLVELCNDEDKHVRISACDVVVDTIQYLSKESLVSTITPLCMKLIDTALHTHDEVTVVISRVLGPMCHALEHVLSDREKTRFITAYSELAQLGNTDWPRRDHMPDVVPLVDNARTYAECRYYCAYNMPAMVLFANARGSNLFPMLYPIISALSGDSLALVRQTIARSLHEVARVLGSQAVCLRTELLRLLRDDVVEVLSGLLPHLSATLHMLVQCRAFSPDHLDLELGRSLLRCEGVLSRCLDWRLHETLLMQMHCLPLVLPSDFLYTHVTALLFDCIHNVRQRPVRLAACSSLLHLLRYNTRTTQRSEIMSRITLELAHGVSCHSRWAYIKMAAFSIDIFSSKFFKEFFCLPLLELAEDSVANNRLLVVAMMPSLKIKFSLPSDKRHLATLESKIRHLLDTERDRDVLACLQSTVNKMDAIEVAQDSACQDSEECHRLEEESRIAAKCGAKSGNTVLRLRQPGSQRNTSHIASTVRPRSVQLNSAERVNTPRAYSIRTPRTSTLLAPSMTPFIRAAPDPGQTRAGAGATSFASLEEEFYVDAGIKIPASLSLSSLPSRIPNTSLSDLGIARQRSVSLKSVLMTEERPGRITVDKSNRRQSYIEKLQVSLRDQTVEEKNHRRSPKESGEDKKAMTRRHEHVNLVTAAENLRIDDHDHKTVERKTIPRRSNDNRRSLNVTSTFDKMCEAEHREESKMAAPRQYEYNRRSLNFTSTSDRVNRRHSSMDVLESRLQPPGYTLKNTTEATSSNSRAAMSSSHAHSRLASVTRKISPAPLRTTPNSRTSSSAGPKIRPTSLVFSKTAPSSRSGSPNPSRMMTNSRAASHTASKTAPNSRPGSPTPLRMSTNSRAASHTASKTAPNSRPASPTNGSNRGSFSGFRSFDVGSRLPVRKRV